MMTTKTTTDEATRLLSAYLERAHGGRALDNEEDREAVAHDLIGLTDVRVLFAALDDGHDECVDCGRMFDARPSDRHPICPDCR
jgi:hypothetical protein